MVGRSGQHSGFTLLELLVAMTLMVVTSACLYTSLYTGFRARSTALAAIEPTSQAINAIELIKQDVSGVLPADGVLAGSFIGTNSRNSDGDDADSLEFYTTQVYTDEDVLVGGLGKIELTLEEDTDEDRKNYRLVRKVTTNLLSSRDVDPEEQVLCRNVTSLNLRYFDGDSWLNEWDSTEDANSLPLAMEVDIEVVHDTKNGVAKKNKTTTSTKNTTSTALTRSLLQSFEIPCGGAVEEEDDSTTGTGQSGQGAG